jgi:hypothetical protein
MVVLSNRSVGAQAELLVSEDVATEMLLEIAAAARPLAAARWEQELVRWLEDHADPARSVDAGEIAWTPDHFETQRRFVIEAIAHAADRSRHAAALDRWRRMIEAHPREAVQFGRRWQWRDTTAMRDTGRDVADRAGSGTAVGYVGTSDLPLGG